MRSIGKSHITGRMIEGVPDIEDEILLIGFDRATDLEIITIKALCFDCGRSPEIGSALDTIIDRAASVEHFYDLCTERCHCTPIDSPADFQMVKQ